MYLYENVNKKVITKNKKTKKFIQNSWILASHQRNPFIVSVFYLRLVINPFTTDCPKGNLQNIPYTTCSLVTNHAVSVPFGSSITDTMKYFTLGFL